MNAELYAAILGAAFVVGLAMLGALAIIALDWAIARRPRPASRPRDPYADAQALAARRADHATVGRARVPVASCSEPSWPR